MLTCPARLYPAQILAPSLEELLERNRLGAVVHHLHAGVSRVALGLDEALGRGLLSDLQLWGPLLCSVPGSSLPEQPSSEKC